MYSVVSSLSDFYATKLHFFFRKQESAGHFFKKSARILPQVKPSQLAPNEKKS